MSTVHVAVMVRCKHCGGEFEVVRFHTSQAAMTAHEARSKPILTPIKVRTPDAQACETLRATLQPVVAHAQCEPVKPRAK